MPSLDIRIERLERLALPADSASEFLRSLTWQERVMLSLAVAREALSRPDLPDDFRQRAAEAEREAQEIIDGQRAMYAQPNIRAAVETNIAEGVVPADSRPPFSDETEGQRLLERYAALAEPVFH